MKNILKKCFATTRRTIISIICIIAAVALVGSVTVYAAAKTTAIGSDAAANYAFADAGVDPTVAENLKTEFGLESGQFVYEVEFTADGSEYEYWIKASDGTVVKKSVEIVTLGGETVTATATITLDEAKEIALADAGLTAADVTFTEAKLDYDDDMSVYDVEFYTENEEYEYEINANTGAVYSKSKETLITAANVDNTADAGTETAEINTETAEINTENVGNTDNTDAGTTDTTGTAGSGTTETTTGITLAEAKTIALADASVTETEVTYTKAKTDKDDGVSVYDIEFYTSTKEYEYEIRVSDGVIVDKSVETIKTTTGGTGNTGSTGSSTTGGTTGSGTTDTTTGITLAEAKSIALADAGVTESAVTYTKAKTDIDDGVAVYDIEFYTSTKEYEYEIRVSDGKILDKDVETIKTSTGSGNSTGSGTTGNTGSGTTTDTYITVDEAKTIALNKAGLSASDVTFEKAKLEKDDGIMVYEIEFSKGRTEYECTINATTGAIIEYEVDVDD